jgi:hypothetical protein
VHGALIDTTHRARSNTCYNAAPILTRSGVGSSQACTDLQHRYLDQRTFDPQAGKTPGSKLRVEAAAWRGKPVFFRIIGPWTVPERMPAPGNTSSQVPSLIMVYLVLISACGIAWHNFRAGKSDRRGAFEMGGIYFLCMAGARLRPLLGLVLLTGLAFHGNSGQPFLPPLEPLLGVRYEVAALLNSWGSFKHLGPPPPGWTIHFPCCTRRYLLSFCCASD